MIRPGKSPGWNISANSRNRAGCKQMSAGSKMLSGVSHCASWRGGAGGGGGWGDCALRSALKRPQEKFGKAFPAFLSAVKFSGSLLDFWLCRS